MPKTPDSKKPKKTPLFVKTTQQAKKLQKKSTISEEPQKKSSNIVKTTSPSHITSQAYFFNPNQSPHAKKTPENVIRFNSPELSMAEETAKEPEEIKQSDIQSTFLFQQIDLQSSPKESSLIAPSSAKKSLENIFTNVDNPKLPFLQQPTLPNPAKTIEVTATPEETLDAFKKRIREQTKQIEPQIENKSGQQDSIKETQPTFFTGLECVASPAKEKKREKPSERRLQEIGYQGEAIAYEHLCRKHAGNPAIKITWHNEITESELPYDISIEFSQANGEVSKHYYEVKSTTSTEKNEYIKLRFSDNETAQMRLHGEKYHVLRIYAVESKRPIIKPIDELWKKQFGKQGDDATSSIQSVVMSFKLKL